MTVPKEDLEKAIKQNQFLLHYQPIISFESLTVAGVEALLRWKHPEKGVLTPDYFLDELKQHNLLVDAAVQIIDESFSEWKSLIKQDLIDESLFIGINLSLIELTSDKYISTLETSIEELHPELETLFIELPETHAQKLFENNSELANRLKALSPIEFCVDNFGLDHPSMMKMQSLPVSTIKLDRHFVNPEDPPNQHLELADHLINFAQECETTIIAEGIETDQQFENFYRLGCDYAQGFYFSEPILDNQSWAHDENELKSIVRELGGPGSSSYSRETNVKIAEGLSVLLAAHSSPTRKRLINCLSNNDIQHQTESSLDKIRTVSEDFSWDTLVIDNQLAEPQSLRLLCHTFWENNSDAKIIFLGRKSILSDLGLSDNNEKLPIIEKPVDRSDFLQHLSQISLLQDQDSPYAQNQKSWTNSFSKQGKGFYAVLSIGFILLGITLGYAITGIQTQISSIFQSGQSRLEKIDKLLNSSEDIDNKKELLESLDNSEELKDKLKKSKESR